MSARKKGKTILVYLSTKQIAQVLGWPTYRARNWLKKEGAAVKIGRSYYTTPARLRAAFPDMADVMTGARFWA